MGSRESKKGFQWLGPLSALRGAGLLLAMLLSGVPPAGAQTGQPVLTNPSPVRNANASSTITVTNTFQTVFADPGSTRIRQGCLVQNKGANAMYVFFGLLADATLTKSYILDSTHGLAINCATTGGGVAQDAIQITGTSGDSFAASQE